MSDTNNTNKYRATIPENNTLQTTPNYRDSQRVYEIPQETNFIKQEFDRMKLGEPERASVNEAHAKIDKLNKMLLQLTTQMGPAFEEVNQRLTKLEERVDALSRM
jgi:uncharacterized phage infection (PIP) family protein YhgE